ncbi:MAG: biopolymer transporter ExbD, partial [Bryobacteraceae bacterium]
VSITRDAKIFLNERPLNIHQIAPEIARRFKGAKSVYVMADRTTPFDPIAQVIAELGDAKYDIKLVAKPIDTARR